MNSVVELTASDFENNGIRLKNYKDKYVLIKFYALWCGHCKNMAENYKLLANSLSNNKNIVIAEFRCDDEYGENIKNVEYIENVFNKFNNGPKILGYPTILLYKDNNFLLNYEGGRDYNDFKRFLKEKKII